ncbi:hypothetical protein HN873_059544 [Arachis hypogaea]
MVFHHRRKLMPEICESLCHVEITACTIAELFFKLHALSPYLVLALSVIGAAFFVVICCAIFARILRRRRRSLSPPLSLRTQDNTRDDFFVDEEHGPVVDHLICFCFHFIGSIELQIGRRIYLQGLRDSESHGCDVGSSSSLSKNFHEMDSSSEDEDQGTHQCGSGSSKDKIPFPKGVVESLMNGQLNLPFSKEFSLPSAVPCLGGCGEAYYCRRNLEQAKSLVQAVIKREEKKREVMDNKVMLQRIQMKYKVIEDFIYSNRKLNKEQNNGRSRALEPATLVPLQLIKSSGTKCIMVGDPKELPATILSNVASKYLYECSMFERLQRAGHPVIMLTEQLTWSNVSIQAEGLPWCRFPFLVSMRDLVWFSLHGKPKFSFPIKRLIHQAIPFQDSNL